MRNRVSWVFCIEQPLEGSNLRPEGVAKRSSQLGRDTGFLCPLVAMSRMLRPSPTSDPSATQKAWECRDASRHGVHTALIFTEARARKASSRQHSRRLALRSGSCVKISRIGLRAETEPSWLSGGVIRSRKHNDGAAVKRGGQLGRKELAHCTRRRQAHCVAPELTTPLGHTSVATFAPSSNSGP